MTALEDTVAMLGDLVAFPTVSHASNRALVDYAADRLERAGATVEVIDAPEAGKANLFATIGPMRDGGIVLSGHTDVVPADEAEWASDPFVMREADGRLFGRGTCDMKGFIAACLVMAPRFAALDLARPVHLAFTYDEEVGCLGARALVDTLRQRAIRPAAAIVGEPTNMQVVEAHKGCHEYTTRVDGLEGHGSNPDAGVNAVEFAVRYATRLLALGEDLKARAPDASPFNPPWTTLQVGRIEGGSARNVIAGHCAVEWEMRPVSAADAAFVKTTLDAYVADTLLPAMRAVHAGSAIETEAIGEVPGLEPAARSEARAIALALTGNETSEAVAFGTEAGLFQGLGLSAVVCGPGSITEAHKPNEFVETSELAAVLSMLEGLAGPLKRDPPR